MKGLVIYKSRYGATEQYAAWMANELKIPAVKAENVTEQQINDCDYIIAGASIYIGKILLKDWLVKNSSTLLNKKLFVYIVGAAPPKEKEKTAKYFSDNLPPALLKHAQCFYMQGKSIFSELSWLDKLLLKAGAKFAPTPELKKEMLTEFNAVQQKNIDDLIKAVKEFSHT